MDNNDILQKDPMPADDTASTMEAVLIDDTIPPIDSGWEDDSKKMEAVIVGDMIPSTDSLATEGASSLKAVVADDTLKPREAMSEDNSASTLKAMVADDTLKPTDSIPVNHTIPSDLSAKIERAPKPEPAAAPFEPAKPDPFPQPDALAGSASFGQQPTYSQPPAYNHQPTYQQQSYNNPLPTVPPNYKPISVLGYVGYMLLFGIPCVGLICSIAFATGATPNVNVKNYARSYILFWIIIAALFAILYLFAPTAISSILTALLTDS